VQEVFRFVQGGTIPEIRVETRGRSFAEALESKDALVAGNLRGVKLFVPGPDLDLENVAGSLLTCRVVEARCSVTLGKAKGRAGAVRVGLTGPSRPFHLDIMVETDARELQSLLIRYQGRGVSQGSLSDSPSMAHFRAEWFSAKLSMRFQLKFRRAGGIDSLL
jgi:hypothetical protein